MPGRTLLIIPAVYGNTGKLNIEFEAKVFKDIIMEVGMHSAFYLQDTEEQIRVYEEYLDWLNSVKNDKSILQNKSVYNYWLDLFIEHNPIYSSPKSNNFKSFHGLSDLISKSKCF